MKEKSYILNGPDYPYKYPEGTAVGQILKNHITSHGTKVALKQQETGEELTYKEILDKSCKLAIYLKNNGVKLNDRIAICSENNIGWATPICATLFVGATICPLNPFYSKREFEHTVNISKPNYIFVSPKTLKNVKSFIKDLSWSPILILMLDHAQSNIPSVENLILNIPSSNAEHYEIPQLDPNEHIATILCSSGTTGLPKGVMLTDKNYTALFQIFLHGSERLFIQDDVSISLLPLFHSYCFTSFICGLCTGQKNIIFSQFNENAFLETIEKYKIQILLVVPPIMVFLAKHPIIDKYDLSSIKQIICGAAPLSKEIEEAVKQRLHCPLIKQGYGMTELTLTVVKVPANYEKRGSIGKLLPGVSAKVVPVSENGKWSDETLGPNCEGELCFKGDIVMKGYYGDKVSTSLTIEKDGWLHTGDIGYYDEDGFFFIVDRLKELIKYKGFQVTPAELEAILLTHKEIKDAAVVGLPDEVAGELPFAFVVKQPNAKITADEIVKYVNEKVSNPKRLRGGVTFLEDIPKSPTGKILRRDLRNLLKSKF